MASYHQGKYKPQNPKKYKGDINNCIFRSSWELKAFRFCDLNNNIIKWGSEEIVIPYFSPIDNKSHRYFVDLYLEYIDKSGKIQKKIAEIKPSKETRKPSKRSKRYLTEAKTYVVNQTKWKYATKWAKSRGMEFIILTEKELGIK